MLDQTKRIVIDLPSINAVDVKALSQEQIEEFKKVNKVEKLEQIFSLSEAIHRALPKEFTMRKFKHLKIMGKMFDGKSRGALIVGDSIDAQIEYVDSTEDYVVRGLFDLDKLVVVSAKDAIKAVVVLQF